MLDSVCVCVCVPGLYDGLTGQGSDMNYRHDCRQQQPTSGCQVALETLGDQRQKAEKQEGGLIFHLPLTVPKISQTAGELKPRLEKSTFFFSPSQFLEQSRSHFSFRLHNPETQARGITQQAES